VTHPEFSLYRGHFSPDEKWILFHADRPGVGTTRVFVAPYYPGRTSPENEWVAVTSGEAFDDAPRWSPDGDRIYYVSDRDGFRCIWMQPLSHLTKKPIGGPVPLRHFHSRHGGLKGVPLTALDLAVAPDRLIYTVSEQRGNLWAVDPR
jgi:eukaryotic-like serine/threonine-protein kinase